MFLTFIHIFSLQEAQTKTLLLEFCQRRLYARHCLTYIFITCSVAYTETFWIAKRIACNRCHMTNFKQVHGEICGISNGTCPIAFSEKATAFRENIESSLRNIHFQPWDVLYKTYYQIAAAFKSLTHSLNTFLRSRISCCCCLLAHRARAACILSLQLVTSLNDPFGSGNKADTPSGHGVSL